MKVLEYPCKTEQSTAVALGRFDGVHPAHKAVITAAAESDGKLLPLVFTFSDNPGKVWSEVLTTEEEKHRLIEACGIKAIVNATFDSVRDMSPVEFVDEVLINSLKAERVFCGYNYRFGKGASGDAEELKHLCEKRGVQVTCVPEVDICGDAVSSSRIKELLREGAVEQARKLLGRAYTLEGKVVHGRALGRTIDTPTLNIDVKKEKLLPKYGVYAARVYSDTECFPAVANIGVKPTVGSDAPTIEAFLLECEGDFYGKAVKLELVGFLRAEQKFSSLEELKAAIENDITMAAEMLGTT